MTKSYRRMTAWRIVALCLMLLGENARAREGESAAEINENCLAEIRRETARRGASSLDPKAQATVDRLCSLGMTERALDFAFPSVSVESCIDQVSEAAVNDDGTLGKEKVSQAFRLCQGGEVDRALAILEGAGGAVAADPAEEITEMAPEACVIDCDSRHSSGYTAGLSRSACKIGCDLGAYGISRRTDGKKKSARAVTSCGEVSSIFGLGNQGSSFEQQCREAAQRTSGQEPRQSSGGNSALDPERDLGVSFESEFRGKQDIGHIAGQLENSSQNAYACVYVEFQLATPSSATKGKGLRPLGTIGTEVRGISPGATVSFGMQLDCPVSFWHKSTSLCENGASIQKSFALSPEIVSFRLEPRTVNRGEFVSLFWEVENAEFVVLYDDHGILNSGSESGWPLSMRGFNQEQLNQDTTFVLWAVGESGCVSKGFEGRVRGRIID